MHVDLPIKEIDLACDALAEGGIIAMPTETVYGLAADASNPDAVARLYELKQRPPEKAFTMQLGRIDRMWYFVRHSQQAEVLAKKFWPGPLTLVLPVKKAEEKIMHLINQADQTMGIRIPDHLVALEILRRFGRPLVVPSANLSGQPPPQTIEAVRETFGTDIDVYVDGGPCAFGVSSTVLRLVNDKAEILREGTITGDAIDLVLTTGIS